MKKFAIKILTNALKLFSDLIVNQLKSEWVKRLVNLTIKRLTLFGEALTDADPNNKEQVEAIARETLMSPEFQELEKHITDTIIAKIPNPKLAAILLETDNLRLDFFKVLADDGTNNPTQIKELFEDFVKSEKFDTIAVLFAELLADKYAKNELTKQFIIGLVTSLVNSDDN